MINSYYFFLWFFFRRIIYLSFTFRNIRFVGSNVTTSIEKDQIADLEKNIIKRKAQLYDIEQTLPQKNGTYLKVRDFKQIHYNFSQKFSDSLKSQRSLRFTIRNKI